MKFKHGDRVTCTIDGTKITDAKISIDKNETPYICQNFKDGTNADDKLGYKYSWVLNSNFIDTDVTDLKLAEITFDTLSEGDELKNEDGSIRTVLGICGRVIHLSNFLDKNKFHGCWTKQELIENRYTIVQPTQPEVVKMTVAEVAKELGYEVEIIKG